MRSERVVRHELDGNLSRERRVEAAVRVDRLQLIELELGIGCELGTLPREIRVLRVRL